MTDFAAACLAPKTARDYARNWSYFTAHCAEVGLPARVTKPALLSCLARRARAASVGTVERLLRSIRWHARHTGELAVTYDPDIEDVMAGLHRLQPPRRHPPVTAADVAAIARQFGDTPLDRRDRALLLAIESLMFALRVLVQLSRTDLCFDTAGLTLRIRPWNDRLLRIEHEPAAATCAVCALARWITTPGPDPAGLVFVASSPRGGFFRTPIGHNVINTALQRAAFLAYRVPFDISGRRVRAGAIQAATQSGSPVILTYRLGLRNVGALLRYSSFGETSRSAALAVRSSRGRLWYRR